MPLHPPAAVDVAVVVSQEEVDEAQETRRERDVGERTADEVVATVRRPVEPVRHGARVSGASDGEAVDVRVVRPEPVAEGGARDGDRAERAVGVLEEHFSLAIRAGET